MPDIKVTVSTAEVKRLILAYLQEIGVNLDHPVIIAQTSEGHRPLNDVLLSVTVTNGSNASVVGAAGVAGFHREGADARRVLYREVKAEGGASITTDCSFGNGVSGPGVNRECVER